MKQYTILAFALIGMLLFATVPVLAQDTSDTSDASDSTTISDDSDSTDEAQDDDVSDDDSSEIDYELDESVSGMKIGWEKARLWFTFNNEKKAKQELRIAKLRLIQAKIAAQKGDTEAMEGALDAHDRLLEKVRVRVDSIDGESTEEGIKRSATKLIGLERAIEVHVARISRLNEILADADLTDEQRDKVEERISKVEDKTEKLREIEEKKKDHLKIRLRAVTNMTEDEIESEIEDIEDGENLHKFKKHVVKVKIRHLEKVISKLKERVNEEKLNEVDVSLIDSHIDEAESMIAEAKALVEEGKYNEAMDVLKPIGNFEKNIRKRVRKIHKARLEGDKEKLRELIKDSKELDEKRYELREKISEALSERREKLKERFGEDYEVRERLRLKERFGEDHEMRESLRVRLRNRSADEDFRLRLRVDEDDFRLRVRN